MFQFRVGLGGSVQGQGECSGAPEQPRCEGALDLARIRAPGARLRSAALRVQISTIEQLCELGITVICCGGGGIPVSRVDNGDIVGHEAVIDKDRSAALLATELGADALLMLTDVKAVEANRR